MVETAAFQLKCDDMTSLIIFKFFLVVTSQIFYVKTVCFSTLSVILAFSTYIAFLATFTFCLILGISNEGYMGFQNI